MRQIIQQFAIHPVGQGFFYSGSVIYKLDEYNSKNFFCVFDCGSEKKKHCLEEVNKFREETWHRNEPLDLLVISHFHSDHINCIKALLDGRKVNRIVAPFVSFTERLALSLLYRNSTEFSTDNPDSAFTLQFILDPVAAMQSYLTNTGEFIFIQSGEIIPFEPVTGVDLPPEFSNIEADFDIRFPGDLRELSASEGIALRCFGKGSVRTCMDTSPVFCRLGMTTMMEFLFYRKSVGTDEQVFYQTIYNLFAGRFQKINGPVKSSTEYILRILSEKAISRVISEITKKACKAHPGLKITIGQIKNMNTTSLSMLHFNPVSLYNYFQKNVPYDNAYFHSSILKKMDGTNRVVCETPLVYDCGYYLYQHQHYYNFPFDPHRKFPNTLLTSDGLLLTDQEIYEFYEKYQYYWNKFWLFQIPHHGSKKNLDKALLTRLAFDTFLFANFGARNRYGHPSNELINDIILTRHSDKLLEINEYTGLLFGLQIYCYE